MRGLAEDIQSFRSSPSSTPISDPPIRLFVSGGSMDSGSDSPYVRRFTLWSLDTSRSTKLISGYKRLLSHSNLFPYHSDALTRPFSPSALRYLLIYF